MSDETLEISVPKSSEDDESNGGNGSRSTKSYDAFDESVVNYVLLMLEQNGEDVEIPLFDTDARELSEPEREFLSGIEAEYQSAESLFGLDLDRDYVGSPPGPQDDCEQCGDGVCDTHDVETDRHTTIDISKRLNGNHLPVIHEKFGECSIRVGMGKATRHDRDPLERRRYVRIRVGDTEGQVRSAKRAQLDAGVIDESEYIEWCVDNEIHPQPRKKGVPEELEWYAENKQFA